MPDCVEIVKVRAYDVLSCLEVEHALLVRSDESGKPRREERGSGRHVTVRLPECGRERCECKTALGIAKGRFAFVLESQSSVRPWEP